MYLCYFDEVKPDPNADRNNFFIGGIAIEQNDAPEIESLVNDIAREFFGSAVFEKNTEFKGTWMMQGQGACKGKHPEKRMKVLKQFIDILCDERVSKFGVAITSHGKNNKHVSDYLSGLCLYIESVDNFLKKQSKRGILFGDYEHDYVNSSIRMFSQYRNSTGFFDRYDKEITQLFDTIYFSSSHHSRLIQLADIFMYIFQLRYYNKRTKFYQRDILEYADKKGFFDDIIYK